MRRREVMAVAGLGISTLAGFRPVRAEAKQLRIGYQKYGTLVLLKERGTLEKRLAPAGYEVTWTEFPAGPQLLEALNVGAIDFGTTGEAPPIFAQAAGAPLVYVGYEPPAPTGEAIIVPADSPIGTVAESEGAQGGPEQGLQRPLPPAAGTRGLVADAGRHRAGLPAAGRCARRVRARCRRCLGDLGPVPGRGPGGHRCADAGGRQGTGRQPPVLPGLAGSRGTGLGPDPEHHRGARLGRPLGAGQPGRGGAAHWPARRDPGADPGGGPGAGQLRRGAGDGRTSWPSSS